MEQRMVTLSADEMNTDLAVTDAWPYTGFF